MARQARLDSPGLMHHVIARGIERRAIFRSRQDYQDFLARLEYSLEKDNNQILAWALMPNHFHLLIRSGSGGLAPFMRRLMTGYAVSFNIRYKRSGHLFQNRYKSIICEEEPYLMELVRYIHLNPLRAGIVKSLDSLSRYPFTGHSTLMGQIARPWQETGEVLERFGQNIKAAKQKYLEFIRQGVGIRSRPDLLGGGLIRSLGRLEQVMALRREKDRQLSDARVLGDGNFVERVLKEAEERHMQQIQFKRGGIDLRWAAKETAREMGVEEKELFQRGRKNAISRAKAMFIYLGIEYFGKSRQALAEMTRMSGPAATQAKERGMKLFAHSALSRVFENYLLTNVP